MTWFDDEGNYYEDDMDVLMRILEEIRKIRKLLENKGGKNEINKKN